GFRDEAVVEFSGIKVGVLDLYPGVERLEVLDQRVGRNRIGGGVDHDLAFLLRGFDDAGVVGWVALWSLALSGSSERQKCCSNNGRNDVSHNNSRCVCRCLPPEATLIQFARKTGNFWVWRWAKTKHEPNFRKAVLPPVFGGFTTRTNNRTLG